MRSDKLMYKQYNKCRYIVRLLMSIFACVVVAVVFLSKTMKTFAVWCNMGEGYIYCSTNDCVEYGSQEMFDRAIYCNRIGASDLERCIFCKNTWTCFPAGTKVLMGDSNQFLVVDSQFLDEGQRKEGIEKNIEDVIVGDRVVSQDENGNRVISIVTELDQPVRDEMCEIGFVGGDSLRLTSEHPLYTKDGWKSIDPIKTYDDAPSLLVTKLKIGDVVVRMDSKMAEVERFGCWSERRRTYNLILDGGVNTYFAEGYLVHNKGFSCPPGEHPESSTSCKKPSNCNGTVGDKGNCPGLKYKCTTTTCVPDACVDTTWSECSEPCGGGTQTSNCGTIRACNTQACAITGTVYYDPDNTCSTSTPQNVGGALSVSLRNTSYTTSVSAGGTYSLLAPAGTYSYLDLSNIPDDYMCSTGCMQGCPTATSVVSPSVGNNFFLTNNADAWWQVVGAGVYAGSIAGGVTIRSELPSSSARLIIPGTNDLAVLVRASGTVDVGRGEISDENLSARSVYKGKRMDYAFFKRKMGVTPGVTSSFGGGVIDKAEIEGQGEDFYYAVDTADNEVSLASDWVVGSGESYVVFVKGDLLVNHNITVADGGFLAFIVSGDVTVSSDVTQVQGLYVMDGVFTTESVSSGNDSQLVVEGSVVAWGGVSLNRDLGGASNYTTSAEKFVYRTDLIVNMPDKMKSFGLSWTEVAPGTYDE